jgi:thiol-disulfide isomerase/thioredoxin
MMLGRNFIAVLPVLLAQAAFPQTSISGLWDAAVVVNKVEVPFRFEIEKKGNHVQGFFFDGERKVGSTSGSFENGSLKLEYDFLNSTLEATLSGGQLQGSYRRNRAKAKPMEFKARRFTPVPPSEEEPPKIAGSWQMRRTAPDKSKLDVTWHLYLRQSDSAFSGAILKTSGDTGMLTGSWRDGKLLMSHFAGERPLVFEAKLNADGTLAITLDHQYTYRAARITEARAQGIPEPPDPSRFTSVKDPTERFHFSGPDLNGKMHSDADPQFQNKVVIVTIGGSWCPNCHDEAPFLVELYREFHARGLEIVGLSFEQDSDLALARPLVQSFIKRYGIQYTMLVPGTTDETAQKLPQLVNFGVYPTTIFLGRDGRVRSVHAGFASAATGEAHIRLMTEERQMVEQLLSEK